MLVWVSMCRSDQSDDSVMQVVRNNEKCISMEAVVKYSLSCSLIHNTQVYS